MTAARVWFSIQIHTTCSYVGGGGAELPQGDTRAGETVVGAGDGNVDIADDGGVGVAGDADGAAGVGWVDVVLCGEPVASRPPLLHAANKTTSTAGATVRRELQTDARGGREADVTDRMITPRPRLPRCDLGHVYRHGANE